MGGRSADMGSLISTMWGRWRQAGVVDACVLGHSHAADWTLREMDRGYDCGLWIVDFGL
jgi:hypothetical protein